MSAIVEDTLEKVVKRVSRAKEPDWDRIDTASGAWEKVSSVIVKGLDEMKGHGVERPLAALQELAFREALKHSAQEKPYRPLHTVALWLTDSRIRIEQYAETKSDWLRNVLERRYLLKKKKDR
jgi:hypothetical protein